MRDTSRLRVPFLEQLLARGIGSRRGVSAIHLEPYYRQRYCRVHLPVADTRTGSSFVMYCVFPTAPTIFAPVA